MILIIDGYIDEPTCLGVPPYISPYIRYLAGAIRLSGYEYDYKTIDCVRNNDYKLIGNYKLVIICAGNPVPGKYLGGVPISTLEIDKILTYNRSIDFFIGGPIQYSTNLNFNQTNFTLVEKDIESYVYDYLNNKKLDYRYRTIEEINKFSIAGAEICLKHPRYPDIIAEIETYRGCPREKHCSFCIEGIYNTEYREVDDIVREIKTLANLGIKHFRIGKQPDLFTYKSERKIFKNGFPQPNFQAIKELYSKIREEVLDIKTLHLDNVNPGTIYNYPEESFKIAETIALYNTPGDTAAFGVESFDDEVIERNNLKGSFSDIKKAIEIINQAGSIKENGMYKLLPGINLIRGLPGENKETFKINYECLKDIRDSNLLIKRINIRHLSKSNVLKNIKIDKKEDKILEAVFKNYREKIRNEIDVFMLKKIYPVGLKLDNVIIEGYRGEWSLGRQIGTYPIVINIPRKLPLMDKISIIVIDYRERSLVGLRYPIVVRELSYSELKNIPGINNNAGKIIEKKDYNLKKYLSEEYYNSIKDFLL